MSRYYQERLLFTQYHSPSELAVVCLLLILLIVLRRPSLHFPLWCCWQQQRRIGGSTHNCILLVATLLTTVHGLFKTQFSHTRENSQVTCVPNCFWYRAGKRVMARWKRLVWQTSAAVFALDGVADTAAARRCRWGESYSYRVADLPEKPNTYNSTIRGPQFVSLAKIISQ